VKSGDAMPGFSFSPVAIGVDDKKDKDTEAQHGENEDNGLGLP
jgi:hypothetical protein